MAITAWSANVSRSAICLAEKGFGLGPPIDEDDAQWRALAQQRRRQHCPDGGPGLPQRDTVPGTPPRPPGCPRRGSSAGRRRPVRPTVSRVTGTVSPIASDSAEWAVPRYQRAGAPFEAEDRRIRRPAHPGGILGDGLHDRLEVGRRTRDHPQDLGRRRLLLQRLFRLVEQPDVLDRDDGLGRRRSGASRSAGRRRTARARGAATAIAPTGVPSRSSGTES